MEYLIQLANQNNFKMDNFINQNEIKLLNSLVDIDLLPNEHICCFTNTRLIFKEVNKYGRHILFFKCKKCTYIRSLYKDTIFDNSM